MQGCSPLNASAFALVTDLYLAWQCRMTSLVATQAHACMNVTKPSRRPAHQTGALWQHLASLVSAGCGVPCALQLSPYAQGNAGDQHQLQSCSMLMTGVGPHGRAQPM